MSRQGRKIKSIYDRVKAVPEARPLPILLHGDKLSAVLLGASERVMNPRATRIKTTIDALKQTAAAAGSYSLASNQIGITNAIFVMHKELLESERKQWLHPKAYKLLEDTPLYED